MLSIFYPTIYLLFFKYIVLIQVSKNDFIEVIWYFDKHVINIFVVKLNLSFNVDQIGFSDIDNLNSLEFLEEAGNFTLELKIFIVF